MSDEILPDGEIYDDNEDRLPKVIRPTQAMTPAQAKVEAVANLTMRVYERASTLQLTDEERAKLQADFPDSAFKTGAGGKENLIYIEHAYLRDRMNEVFGPGAWTIIPRSRWTEDFVTAKGKKGVLVYVEAMLCVRGCFVGEAIGDMAYYHNDQTNFADAVEGAKTAAMRRCLKELGVGLQAWKDSWRDGWWERRRKNQTGSPPKQPDKPPPTIEEKADWFRKTIPSAHSPKGDADNLRYFGALADGIRKEPFAEDVRNELLNLLDERAAQIGLGPKPEPSPLADPNAGQKEKITIPF